MKTVLTTLNAKYIHTSLALRWLYVANKDKHAISFVEYTIKENIDTLAKEIAATGCAIVGVSVAIWNVDKCKELCAKLKEINPQLTIIVGGPEVMYEPAFFLAHWQIDYVISGEGEFVLGELLDALKNDTATDIDGVSTHDRISQHIAQADIEKLATLPSPYMLQEDVSAMQNKLVYFESSRGCPYQCLYCLSSLEKGVRYFPMDYITTNLHYLIEKGAKQIKFLDRTFNLNKEHTYHIFSFLIAHHRENLSCQFEIYADILTDELIAYLNEQLPTDFFRFEIGIQSTYPPTNIAVKRRQDFPLLASNIEKIMGGGKINLHLDLIAGLPYETYDRFVKSFNDVFALRAKEVQLGFLKMLRGTALRANADKYGYLYDSDAPYQIISNNDISQPQLARIHDAEHALEKFWNSGRFSRSMNYLFDTEYKGAYFQLFDDIAHYYNSYHLPHRGYQLEDLFRYLNDFLQEKGIDIFPLLRADYYHNFSRRPSGFWTDGLGKKLRNRLYYNIGQDKIFLQLHHLTRYDIEKLTAIDKLSDCEVLLTVYSATDGTIKTFSYTVTDKLE